MEKEKPVKKQVVKEDPSLRKLYHHLKDQDSGEGVYIGDDLYLLPCGAII
mgnify:CR=1 FL=1|jgi:hypothetical protein|tara:strand:- start:627 stop:776 length:150 start_codon:yes stop_codon:yes gene_type:complete